MLRNNFIFQNFNVFNFLEMWELFQKHFTTGICDLWRGGGLINYRTAPYT